MAPLPETEPEQVGDSAGESADEPASDPTETQPDPTDLAPPPGLSAKLVPLYQEAVDIAERSPASACALLRLLLRTLIGAAGVRSRHIVRDIETLVTQGAPMGLMRALDVLKLSDNEARRPGEVNLLNGHREAQNLMLVIHLFVKHVTGAQEPDAPAPGSPTASGPTAGSPAESPNQNGG